LKPHQLETQLEERDRLIPAPRHLLRFGAFDVDVREGELRKSGIRIRVQGQPMMVLFALLERPGQIVTREELQQRLWPDVEHLDFEHGLNVAVKKLRKALNDSAETPRYIETLARRGYRFIGTIEETEPPGPEQVPAPPQHEEIQPSIVVLPFANTSRVADDEIFFRRPCEGNHHCTHAGLRA
jgi:DNA-binding winged helix-turn-helix (wHTH) protein